MANNTVYDVVVIGGGVAAAACVRELLAKNLSVCLFDKGGYDRDPSKPHDLANGVLGAGSFSDGKYSFFPAGTAVWQLPDKFLVQQGLALAIREINDAVAKTGQTIPALDETELVGAVQDATDTDRAAGITDLADNWQFKPYPSVYVPLAARRYMMGETTKLFKPVAKMEHVVVAVKEYTTVHDAAHEDDEYKIYYQQNGDFDHYPFVYTKAIVVAGGRFAPFFLPLENCPRVFRRIEIGVRLLCDAKNPAWERMKGVDPKYICNSGANTENGQRQYRSFCCCRQGITAVSSFQGLHTYSGRADCPPTGESNIGFTVRSYDSTDMPEFRKVVESLRKRDPCKQTFSTDLDMARALLREYYGSFADPLEAGIKEFLKLFPELATDPSLRLQGPVIEGCGEYWQLDDHLRIPGQNIWVAGDSTGIFRGLVPAMVSGHYVAHQILAQRDEEKSLTSNGNQGNMATSEVYPALTGKDGAAALHEIHVFLMPLNPDSETVAKYVDLVDQWNKAHYTEPNFKPMKAPYLALEFRGVPEPVCVLQSARYLVSDDTKHVVEQCHADAKYFQDHGFTVLREKIEATVHGIDGIPQTAQELAAFPTKTKYFEFHIRAHRKGDEANPEPLRDEELAELRSLSETFGDVFNKWIPLSWNVRKAKDGVHQRFFNMRERVTGAVDALALVKDFQRDIAARSEFVVGKVISEFVWYDTYAELDQGWIDPRPDERKD